MTELVSIPSSYERAIPVRAVVLSVGALAVAVAGAVFAPEAVIEYGFLMWLLALVPAFLLCHYRGWSRILLVLSVVMVALAAAYIASYLMAWRVVEWPVLLFVVATYIGLALGWGWFTEVQTAVEERQETEAALQITYEDLKKSKAELKLAQWKLIEAEKLEAVGKLAAGVAHEVKNPLMTLLTGVRYLCAHSPVDSDDVKILLDDMRVAVERADAVITGLLDFSAPRELTLAPANLNKLVGQSATMVKYEMDKAKVALTLELGENIPELLLDEFKIHQVFVNVMTNAAHATPPGGTVTATTSLTRDGTRVVVHIDDTGTGIDEDKLIKLFDPFFTTKPTGKGTGLGLSVVRQIVDMHGGSIDICNRDECGVRVTVVFSVPGES